VSGFAARFRALALSFPETYEDSPWGHPVFKVGANKMFATMGNGEPLQVTVKLTSEERQVALELPFVRVAAYVGRYGWVTATVTDDETLDAALEWLRESYWLNAPAALRDAAFAD
jgi:predicted DNA-binding protein (MmcQ/YjbR family)